MALFLLVLKKNYDYLSVFIGLVINKKIKAGLSMIFQLFYINDYFGKDLIISWCLIPASKYWGPLTLKPNLR